jgi:3-dehydro-4-phosphotetronate decarboxylase
MSGSKLEQLCELASSLYARGYAYAATGNLSVRIDGKIWITPTGGSLRRLSPEELACTDLDGINQNSNAPSKELPFHLAVYRNRSEVNAVVHLHSTYSVALSCLENLDPDKTLPVITPYYIMRVAPLGIVPYCRPGSPQLAQYVEEVSREHNSMLLRNHGSICIGSNLNQAVDRIEELEETARLFFILRGERTQCLTPEQIEELKSFYS